MLRYLGTHGRGCAILNEIGKQFDKALAHEKALKATPVGAHNDLPQKGTAPDSYRPTLFDFLAFNALDFRTAGIAGIQRMYAPEFNSHSKSFELEVE